MTQKPSIFLRHIQDRYPDLTARTARLNTSGQNSDILILNEEIVFRFPRYPHGIARLRTEAALLRTIQPSVTLPVPNPIYRHLDTDTPGAAFIGYAMLPGAPLWREVWNGLDPPSKHGIAAQLAIFLRMLHRIPICELPYDSPIMDGRAYWQNLYSRIHTRLFTQMRPEARIAVARHFETFLDDPDNFVWAPTLRHGDFGPSNILFDPAMQQVTGIIDFGSAARGDPAVDIAALSAYGPDFLAAFRTMYPLAEAMLARVAFYRGTFALQEALFGIEHGDPQAFASGIASYR